MASKALLCALALLLMAGCQGDGEVATADAATDVTNRYMSENVSTDYNGMAIEALDMGDRWRVSYRWPEGGTGGPMIFVVNKRSGEIVHMETEQ